MTASRPMSVVFRVDASLDIGTGHVMRCLTLADALAASGADCRFICREHPGHLIEHIRNKGYQVDALPAINEETCPTESPSHARWLGCRWETDAAETRAILNQSEPEWLVVDHYAVDARWEKALQGSYKKLMVIDDLADRPHACDLLLDQNLGREPGDYEALVSAHCQRLIGPQYALLRPEFAALREYSLQRRRTPELKRLLITMGGVDQPNATSKVLEALKASPLPSDCQITVVMGARAPWIELVRSLAATMPWPTSVRVNISDMAQVMADSDLAIGAAGSTSWERCCLGLPTLLVIQAENQKEGGLALQQRGAARLLGKPDAIPRELKPILPMLLEEQSLVAMIHAASAVTDGRGAPRVLVRMGELA
ncbi:MAG: UDP-2,4-diacetamido-2,4,6-trideoxy-beta-L-altropyranose hydrolase [Halothiobacillus sp.]|nr:UDP-2,4-diacetamido-2,4,6-trideoxy-beta-L-altropyranose hydrolase [Halothiobacillus sp.]